MSKAAAPSINQLLQEADEAYREAHVACNPSAMIKAIELKMQLIGLTQSASPATEYVTISHQGKTFQVLTLKEMAGDTGAVFMDMDE